MDVKTVLNSVFRRVFDNDSIAIFDEMTANDVEEWDSLAHINLIMEIESEFSLKFTVDDILGLRNVGEMIRLIERKLAARGSS
ncbi:MAG: acyl carrier protein [Betaproteobacteria bacterium RIFCSPLOWO2_12_FULL_62_13]|nr:MAG: acyl carrier protein [Betaproteobacteria bacterium RIFCSPLOWO2_12_FULL_62_13]